MTKQEFLYLDFRFEDQVSFASFPEGTMYNTVIASFSTIASKALAPSDLSCGTQSGIKKRVTVLTESRQN